MHHSVLNGINAGNNTIVHIAGDVQAGGIVDKR